MLQMLFHVVVALPSRITILITENSLQNLVLEKLMLYFFLKYDVKI